MKAEVPVIISTAYSGKEKNLYLGSWRAALKDSPAGEDMKDHVYTRFFNIVSADFLGPKDNQIELAPDCHLLTVRRQDQPDTILSWMLLTNLKPGAAIHFCFTKYDFRNRGYARLLLGVADEIAGGGPLYNTVLPRTNLIPTLKKYGIEYVPIDKYVRKNL